MTQNNEHLASEAELREQLAAAYRLAAMLDWEDTIYTHFSARLPGRGEPRFLINPFGLMFDEIRASDLIIVDMNGKVLEGSSDYNLAGFTIHSAVHMAREDAHCVMHTHTLAGMAVAASEEGLLNLNQISTEFHGRLGYHEYEGVAFNLEERSRIQASLSHNIALILRHHGLLSVGGSIPDAFQVMYYLNKACEIQLACAQMGALAAIKTIPDALAAHVCDQFKSVEHERHIVWDAWVRKLDRLTTDYKD